VEGAIGAARGESRSSWFARRREKKTEKKNKDKISLPLLTPVVHAPSLNSFPKQALKDAGVDEVVLAINYQPQVSLSGREIKESKLEEKKTRERKNRAATAAVVLSVFLLPSQFASLFFLAPCFERAFFPRARSGTRCRNFRETPSEGGIEPGTTARGRRAFFFSFG